MYKTHQYTRPVWLLFSRWFAHLHFGLGRGPITPSGPATVRMGRKDLNSTKPNQNSSQKETALNYTTHHTSNTSHDLTHTRSNLPAAIRNSPMYLPVTDHRSIAEGSREWPNLNVAVANDRAVLPSTVGSYLYPCRYRVGRGGGVKGVLGRR